MRKRCEEAHFAAPSAVCYTAPVVAVAPIGPRWTFEAVESLERLSGERFELIDGQIYAMAGGTPEHAGVIAEVIGQLHVQLKGSSCRVYSSDLKAAVRDDESFRYPDLSVVCGSVETDDRGRITNPTVLFEVTSPSTRSVDIETKAEEYLNIESLQGYIVIDLQERQVVTFERSEGVRYNDRKVPGVNADLDLAALFEIG